MRTRLISLRNIYHAPYHWLFYTTKRSFSSSTLVFQRGLAYESKKDISVKTMTKDDLKMVMGWAAQEGWNPGKYEVEPLYKVDPKGYKILWVNGEPIASLASVRHSHDFAFLGLYIVRPQYRGQGYGKLLWDVAMGSLKDCRTIGLNGVLDQVESYAKSGFKPATLNTRWKGNPQKETIDAVEKARAAAGSKAPAESKISLTQNFSLTSIIDYDAKIFSTPREAFLSKWLKMPESHVLAAVDNGILRGYGVLSTSHDGYKLAPLFADNEIIAEQLYIRLCQCAGSKAPIHFDTNQNSPFAESLAKRFGLEKTFDTLRMYRGEAPPSENRKIFGLTSLEIG